MGNIGIFVLGLWALWLFSRQSSRFPKIFIGLLVLRIAVQVLLLLVMEQIPEVAAQPVDPEVAKSLFQFFITAVIWIPYILTSRRVKNTFVEP